MTAIGAYTALALRVLDDRHPLLRSRDCRRPAPRLEISALSDHLLRDVGLSRDGAYEESRRRDFALELRR
jgi:hypothetical protein